MKKCSQCKIEKFEIEFSKNKYHNDGLQHRCKVCLKQNYEKNKDRILIERKQYYELNKEHIKQQHKEYCLANADTLSRKRQKHYKVNKDKIISQHLVYERKKRKTDITFRIRSNLRSRLYNAIKRNYKSGSAVNDLGCSVREFMAYIEKQFLPGMSWTNYGEWHLDHIQPLISFDLMDREQFLRACHYTNYQPLWAADNLSKGKRVWLDEEV